MPVYISVDDGDSLQHYGVLGMKWGVRRYRNKDGSLTKAGKKRYQNGETAYKDLKKQVRRKRGELNGGANRWMVNKPIGENSKAYLDKMRKKEDAYKNSDKYKEWETKMDSWQKEAEKHFEADNSEKFWNEYDSKYKELMKQKPKRNFSSPYEAGVTIQGFGASGRKYTNGYLKGAGKQLSLAYLADLGYSTKDAEYLVNNMLKRNRTLGFV